MTVNFKAVVPQYFDYIQTLQCIEVTDSKF